jgi:hypothetical protein
MESPFNMIQGLLWLESIAMESPFKAFSGLNKKNLNNAEPL